MTYGPFFLMDLVGLDVIFAIEMTYFSDSRDPRDEPPGALKEKIGRGELGLKTNKGFYSYPNPECATDGFLRGK